MLSECQDLCRVLYRCYLNAQNNLETGFTERETKSQAHHFAHGDSVPGLEFELVLVQTQILKSASSTADPPPALNLQAYNKCS